MRLRAARADGTDEDVLAGLSDGELLWIMGVNEQLPPRSEPDAREEALWLRRVALYEQVRRISLLRPEETHESV